MLLQLVFGACVLLLLAAARRLSLTFLLVALVPVGLVPLVPVWLPYDLPLSFAPWHR